jgi:diguanylate cyclase (GGDEF)-like protein
MPVFDVATSTALIGFLSILIASTFRGVHERTLRTSAGGQWALSAFLGGCAALLTSFGGGLPGFMTTVVDNMLTVASLVFIHRGAAMFAGTPHDDRKYLAVLALATAGFIVLSYVFPSVERRVGLVSSLRAGFYLATLFALNRPALPAGTRYLRAILAVATLWNLARLAVLARTDGQVNTFLSGGPAFAVMVAIGGVLQILINAFQFRLESERTRDELLQHAGRLQAKRNALQATVTERTAELTQLATTDSLTGLANRRHFMEQGWREIERARRYRQPLALMLVDIDHFKDINDRHGHPVGDRVLQMVAQACRASARNADLPGRIGGEEFGLLMPETGMVSAQLAAERMRRAVAAADFSAAGLAQGVTASIGVAVLEDGDATLERLLARADKALYQAKQFGRNRVVLA